MDDSDEDKGIALFRVGVGCLKSMRCADAFTYIFFFHSREPLMRECVPLFHSIEIQIKKTKKR